MPEPEADGSEFYHGEEVGDVLFVTRGDTAAMFDLVEEPLDVIACSIERGAEFMPHDSRPQFWRLNHIRHDAINCEPALPKLPAKRT